VSLVKDIDKDMIVAMKAHDSLRLTTIRMMKSTLKNREIEKREPLTDAEAVQALATMIKQRKESIEAFTKGNRPELAAKEAAEIVLIEGYMPKEAGEEQIRPLVTEAIAEITAAGTKPGPRDMGAVMKAVQAKIQATGLRADGRAVSELVKAELGK
jgi:uncharacterized protein YqeY